MSESTRDRYHQIIRHFTNFLGDKNFLLAEIQKSTIAMFKVDRQKKIEQLKQSRGGSSIALDVAVLHRMFAFAVSEGLMSQKPISLNNVSATRTPSCKDSRRNAMLRHDQALKEGLDEVAKAGLRAGT
jgi:site-specific recombinase XerD